MKARRHLVPHSSKSTYDCRVHRGIREPKRWRCVQGGECNLHPPIGKQERLVIVLRFYVDCHGPMLRQLPELLKLADVRGSIEDWASFDPKIGRR